MDLEEISKQVRSKLKGTDTVNHAESVQTDSAWFTVKMVFMQEDMSLMSKKVSCI